MKHKEVGVFLLLFTVVLWGPGPVVTKLTLHEIPQFSLALLGRFVALLCMGVLFFRKGYFTIQRADAKKFFFAGLLGQGLNLGLFFFALQHTSATTGQAIMTLAPVTTAIFAFLFLKERITTLQVVGALLALLGAGLITVQGVVIKGNWNGEILLGNASVFLSMLSWVGYILISKRLSVVYSPVTITFYSLGIGFLMFLPFSLIENMRDSSWIYSVSFYAWLGVLYQGVFASVLALLAYQAGLRLTSAFTAGMVLYLNPIATTLVAVPVLGERITLLFVMGTALILLGSFIATQFENVKAKIFTKLFS